MKEGVNAHACASLTEHSEHHHGDEGARHADIAKGWSLRIVHRPEQSQVGKQKDDFDQNSRRPLLLHRPRHLAKLKVAVTIKEAEADHGAEGEAQEREGDLQSHERPLSWA